MKERIDKFMKAVREKYPSNGLAWENLYRELSELCKEDDRKELVAEWKEFHQEIKLAKWDDAFMELVINGTTVKEASGATYAQGAVMGWNDVMRQKMADTLVKEASGVNFGEAPLKREGGSYRHDGVQKKFIDDSEFPWL